jgi:hypothetical protein
MPTYANADDVAAYIEGLVVDDPAGLDRLIAHAERDVDRLLGPIPRLEATGLKLDPATLLPWERTALADVVAAQVEYLLDAASSPSPVPAGAKRVKGPDFEAEAADVAGTGLIGTKAVAELERIGHLRVLAARGVA